MLEMIKLYARYNNETNNKIIEILLTLSLEELNKSRNCYWDSILKLFNHIVLSACHYLHVIHTISNGKYCNNNLPGLEEVHELVNISIKESSNLLKILNEELILLADEIKEKDLHLEKKNMKIYNGRFLDVTVWKYLLQFMTHQIHHQGQLSKIFDEMKIEHEFGNVFPLIPDSLN